MWIKNIESTVIGSLECRPCVRLTEALFAHRQNMQQHTFSYWSKYFTLSGYRLHDHSNPFYDSHSLPLCFTHWSLLIILLKISVGYVRAWGLRKLRNATGYKGKDEGCTAGKLARKIFHSIFHTFDTVRMIEMMDIFLFNANSWMHVRSGARLHASSFKL